MYRIVLDTETAGSVDNHKTLRVYDFGFSVIDENGFSVASYSWVVREIFRDSFTMGGAYYANKLPQYSIELENGERVEMNFGEIRHKFIEVAHEYGVKQVWAYNAGFDRDALNATTAILSNGILDEFLPSNMVWCDIWNCAASLICSTKAYFRFASANGLVSKKGNLSTSAESVYRFLIDTPEFVEAHTALRDVEIESAILTACRKKHKKMNREINSRAWAIPQKDFKAYTA